jgi:peptide-methionine (S)-S-oxide reductase
VRPVLAMMLLLLLLLLQVVVAVVVVSSPVVVVVLLERATGALGPHGGDGGAPFKRGCVSGLGVWRNRRERERRPTRCSSTRGTNSDAVRYHATPRSRAKCQTHQQPSDRSPSTMIMRGLLKVRTTTTTTTAASSATNRRAFSALRAARATTAAPAAAAAAGAAGVVAPAALASSPSLFRRHTHPRSARAMAAAASSPSSSPTVDWAALGLSPTSNPNEDVAVIGGGCFWCIETTFNRIKGVSSAISGYAGGHKDRPTYQEVCDKTTGHAEVVAVYFDPQVVSYETLLEVFYALHDPTTKDQQGNDVGPQYRSAIYTIGDEQMAVAQRVMKRVADDKIWGAKPLTTELAPLKPGVARFHPAEKYHQRYYEINGDSNPYCAFVVAPKVQKLRAKFAKLLKEGEA